MIYDKPPKYINGHLEPKILGGDELEYEGDWWVAVEWGKIPRTYWARHKRAYLIDSHPPRIVNGGGRSDAAPHNGPDTLCWIPKEFVLDEGLEGLGEVCY